MAREFIDPWPLDVDLDLSRIEIIMRDWLSIIASEGDTPVVDVRMIIDGSRMLAYQAAAIRFAQARQNIEPKRRLTDEGVPVRRWSDAGVSARRPA